MKNDEAMKKIIVGFLGPKGTFTQEAAAKYFPNKHYTLEPYASIQEVFTNVEYGTCKWGVVPIENSMEGSVGTTLDCLYRTSVNIAGEVEIPVKHQLIGNRHASLNTIKTVISHPQALKQCRSFLEKKLSKAELKEADSTAAALPTVLKLRSVAVIGSASAANIYGLEILARNIGDVEENYTRFLIIGKQDAKYDRRSKTSIVFSTPNFPGALYQALEPFAKRTINLSKIESRPTRDTPWEYVFFVDFEGHRLETACVEALKELNEKCPFLKVLGSYLPASRVVEHSTKDA